MERIDEKKRAWAIIRSVAETKWDERKISMMDGPGRLMEMDNNFSEDVETVYLTKDEAYNGLEKRHNTYWKFRTTGAYVNATEYWVASGYITVEYGENGEIADMYDWDPDGDLDCADTQEKDWKEFYESEFEDEEEDEE